MGLLIMVSQLAEGADTLVMWLTQSDPANPRLLSDDRIGCGLHNDATARFICPVKYDWGNMEYVHMTPKHVHG